MIKFKQAANIQIILVQWHHSPFRHQKSECIDGWWWKKSTNIHKPRKETPEEINPDGSLGFCEKLLCKSLVGAILFMAVVANKHTVDALLQSDSKISSETTR